MVKSFVQAQKYAPEIEKRVIEKASDFLVSRQSKNGDFVELGRVIYRDMQGGVESAQTITAYVTIALLETELSKSNDKIKETVQKALVYLEQEESNVKDSYSLGLIAYALNLSKSGKAKKLYNVFQKKSKVKSDGRMYWSKSSSTSSSIELTSYGLLINLLRKEISTSLSIVRQILGESNSLGGYSNTQDTVLALEALSKFAIATSLADSSAPKSISTNVLLVNAKSKQLANKSFTSNDENSMVLQTWDLPKCEKYVRVYASGLGKVLFQLVTTYNLPQVPETSIFTLSQEMSQLNDGVGLLKVHTCVTYHKESAPNKADTTGMTILEATLLSGYEADNQDLQALVNSGQVEYLKLAQIKDQTVVFYFDHLDDDIELCVDWKMTRKVEVDNLQGVPVKVYDYYQKNLAYEIVYIPEF